MKQRSVDSVSSRAATVRPPGGLLQRKCACGQHTPGGGACGPCARKDEMLRRHATSGHDAAHTAMAVPPVVHEVLRAPGRPLDAATRTFMESRFGHDFTQVRVHTDEKAAESARAVSASAYTVGRDVVFGAGQYVPHTLAGQRILAHELAHTIQQGSAGERPAEQMEISSPDDRHEREADAAAHSLIEEQPFALTRNQPAKISRQASGGGSPACVPGPGLTNATCSAYLANAWWLPFAYVNNATCACLTTPNVPTANCVRKVLQDRLAATPMALKLWAASQKPLDNPATYTVYQSFVQAVLTPRIYADHVIAYSSCCCPSGPAPYPSWIAVTSVPIQPCSLVGLSIRYFGSCSGTPGAW